MVRDGVELRCTGEEILRTMVVREAIKRAMSTGGFIVIYDFEIKERGEL